MAQTKKKFSDMTRHLEGKVLKQNLLPRSLDVLQPKLQHCIQKPTSSPQNQQDRTGEDDPERPKKHSVVKTHICTLDNQIPIKKTFLTPAVENAEISSTLNQRINKPAIRKPHRNSLGSSSLSETEAESEPSK